MKSKISKKRNLALVGGLAGLVTGAAFFGIRNSSKIPQSEYENQNMNVAKETIDYSQLSNQNEAQDYNLGEIGSDNKDRGTNSKYFIDSMNEFFASTGDEQVYLEILYAAQQHPELEERFINIAANFRNFSWHNSDEMLWHIDSLSSENKDTRESAMWRWQYDGSVPVEACTGM